MPVYRYQQRHVDIAILSRLVPGSLVLGSQSPSYVDITAPTGSLSDLDEEMGRRGYVRTATDPSSTPTQQVQTDLGVSGLVLLVDEHFFCGQITGGQIGLYNWKSSVSGTGATVAGQTGEIGHPGIIRLEGGTAAAGRAAIMLGDSAFVGNMILTSTQNQIDLSFDVRPRASVAPADLEMIQAGFGMEWTTTGELLNGVYVRFNPASDVFWTLVTANGGARSASAGTVAPAAGSWARLGVRIIYPGGVPTAQLVVNDVAVGAPLTTNFPAAAVGIGCKIDGNAGMTEPLLDVDRARLVQAA